MSLVAKCIVWTKYWTGYLTIDLRVCCDVSETLAVDAVLSGENVTAAEAAVVGAWPGMLEARRDRGDTQRELAELRDILQGRLGKNVEISTARKSRSIETLFVCRSLPGLQRLVEACVTDRLQASLELIYTQLAGRPVTIRQLQYSQQDYHTCLNYFNTLAGKSL